MSSMQLRPDDVVVGVDTHKDQHVAVLLDGLGGRLAELYLPATAAGFAQLLAFSLEHVGPQGRLQAFGVEGTGSYGIGLARFLRRAGHTVQEVHRPPRSAERRLSGKSATRSTPSTPLGRSWLAAPPPSRRPLTARSSPCGCSRPPATLRSKPAPPA
jgi:hypothetical protein